MVLLRKNLLMMLLMSFVFVLGSAATPGDAQAESKIAFSCLPEGIPAQPFGAGEPLAEICTVNPDGSGLVQVASFPGDDAPEDFAFSPDGSQLVFRLDSAVGDGRYYVVNSDGSDLTEIPLTRATQDHTVAWSPELPSSLASVSPFGQFLLVFMLGGISAIWMMRKREANQMPNAS